MPFNGQCCSQIQCGPFWVKTKWKSNVVLASFSDSILQCKLKGFSPCFVPPFPPGPGLLKSLVLFPPPGFPPVVVESLVGYVPLYRSGSHMATGGADKVVKLWDPATGANTGSLRVRHIS